MKTDSPHRDVLKGAARESAHAAARLGHGSLLRIRPMEAVAALYSEGHEELSEAIIAGLNRAVFGKEPSPAGLVQRAMARLTWRVLKWTTRRHVIGGDGEAAPAGYRNRLLERSRHPYAQSLLTSSTKETEVLVEGGDPMNGPYMMIAPEIRETCTLWDKLFFNSVLGKDVQLRFIWETNATYGAASRRLDRGEAVRLKALAAGTGLSVILAYDRLLRDGYDPDRITARITDREPANTAKTGHLLAKLAASRGWKLGSGDEGGIAARTEDIFADDSAAEWIPEAKYDVVTAVGILEYLQGFTCDTTERRHRLHEPEEDATAVHLAERLAAMTTDDASLIVNTYRPHASTRILELFGKKFDYREPAHLADLLATVRFRPARVVGSGVIYDVKIYEKLPPLVER